MQDKSPFERTNHIQPVVNDQRRQMANTGKIFQLTYQKPKTLYSASAIFQETTALKK